jgi:beta-aspartyl-peptidase (threonine type)
MSELRPEDLPEALDDARRALLVDLGRFWLRISDFRLAQMLREAAAKPVRQPTDLTEDTITEGLPAALEMYPERPARSGPFWDTETKGQGSFLNGRPRDPARIPRVLTALAEAWTRHPDLSIGQLIDLAFQRSGIPDTEGGRPWFGLEDGPMRRILQDLADESRADSSSNPSRVSPGRFESGESERERLVAALRDSGAGLMEPDRFHDWLVEHGGLGFSGFPRAGQRHGSAVARSAPVIAIHAGAFAPTDEHRRNEAFFRGMLETALDSARIRLERGDDAVSVVRTALWCMESLEFCNLYFGAPLCSDRSAQLSAAIMRGTDRAAGALAALRHTKHPIVAAKLLLDDDEVMLVGDYADGHAAYLRTEQAANSYFVNERQLARLAGSDDDRDCATLGAICLDAQGCLAAGTSTGGLRGQPPGRLGGASLIGVGTWADCHVAISCAGDSEAFIRSATARYVATLVACGMSLDEAAQEAMTDLEVLGGRGGLIAVSADGDVAMPLNTEAMPGGIWREGHEPAVWFGRPEPINSDSTQTDGPAGG